FSFGSPGPTHVSMFRASAVSGCRFTFRILRQIVNYLEPWRLRSGVRMVCVPATKRCFDSTQPQTPDSGTVTPRTTQRAAAVGAKHPCLARHGAKFFQQLGTRKNMKLRSIYRAHGDKRRALRLAALRAMAHGNFLQLAIVFVANPTTQTTAFDHRTS